MICPICGNNKFSNRQCESCGYDLDEQLEY